MFLKKGEKLLNKKTKYLLLLLFCLWELLRFSVGVGESEIEINKINNKTVM